MGKIFNKMRFHAPTGQFYVLVDGDRKYLGNEEERARDLYESLKRDQNLSRTPQPPPPEDSPADLTINSLIKRYHDHLEAKGTNTKRWSRIIPALRMLNELHGGRPARELRAKSFRSLREKMIQQKTERDGLPWSRTWINHLGGEIRKLALWANEEELIPAESASSLMLVPLLQEGEGGRETDPREPPEPGVVEATLEHLTTPIRQMIEIQSLTGCRPSELCSLTPSRLSRSPAEKIRLPRSRKSVAAVETQGVLIWVWVPLSHKTMKKGKSRVIPIGPRGQALIGPLLEGKDAEARVFDPRDGIETRRGKVKPWQSRFTVHGYYAMISRALKHANEERSREDPPREPIPHWFPYQLRHQAATEIGDEYDTDTACAMLGHSGRATIHTYMQQQLGKALKVAAERG